MSLKYKVYFYINIFSSGSVHFDLMWKEKNLNKIYGREPRDIAKLADDVYRALKDGGLVTKQFVVHGKHII